MARPNYRPSYSSSHALVIGINTYRHVAPLGYAVADADSMAEVLQTAFGFPGANITVLRNEQASKDAILEAFFQYVGADVDDRLVVFFAGHGHTVTGSRGEIGFLVPSDGNPANIGSLIRWEELTHGADMLAPKHIAFFMDACYGGLALNRTLAPGSMRFLNDMLLRPARQVLTAGKANEPVGDLGGPLPGHSPFTGYLLQGLGGSAAWRKDGVLTANGVMAYVYEAVGRDPRSRQTPHFGYLEGDGDLIFDAPILRPAAQAEAATSAQSEDTLITIPAVQVDDTVNGNDLIDRTKEFLSDDRHRIQLHDTIVTEIRRVLLQTVADSFPVQGAVSNKDFTDRVKSYEEITARLRQVEALLTHWGGDQTRKLIALAPRRLSDQLESASGMTTWIALRWYPIFLLLYAGGIPAVFDDHYENLRELLDTRVTARRGEEEPLVKAAVDGLSDLGESFKVLPGHERHYAARSENIFKLLQPELDDLLFLGSDYEIAFDRFEVFLCLEYMHQADSDWGPVGRFGWKARQGGNPAERVLREGEEQGDRWAPIRAGLFGGSKESFAKVASHLRGLLQRVPWH